MRPTDSPLTARRNRGRAQGGHDVFAHELPLPPLPPRAAYAHAGAPPHAPRAPALDDAALAGLAPKQAARLRSEHSSAAELDEQLWQVRPAAAAPCEGGGQTPGLGVHGSGVDRRVSSLTRRVIGRGR